MKIHTTSLPDVLLLEPQRFGDARGFFYEAYRASVLSEWLGREVHFVQDNHSGSQAGVLRGLHYQNPRPQGKLVRVIHGCVFDVAVDLRRQSPTFGQWFGTELSAENRLQMWVPEGFAHGFYVRSDWAEFVYKCTDYYAPEYEGCIRFDDPAIGIQWPLLEGVPTSLSAKDQAGLALHQAPLFD